jgi:hypothetical protein
MGMFGMPAGPREITPPTDPLSIPVHSPSLSGVTDGRVSPPSAAAFARPPVAASAPGQPLRRKTSMELALRSHPFISEKSAGPARFTRLRPSDKTSKTLANGYFDPDTVEEEAATLRACYLHEKARGWPELLKPGELHEVIAKFKYLNEKERDDIVALVSTLPHSTLRTDAREWLECKEEYLSPQNRTQLSLPTDLRSAHAIASLKASVAKAYEEVEDAADKDPTTVLANFKILAKHIRLLSDDERQMAVMEAKWIKDGGLKEKIAKALLLQPEYLKLHINNVLGMLPNQQTLAPQLPSRQCDIAMFTDEEVGALRQWGGGSSLMLNGGIAGEELRSEDSEARTALWSAYQKLEKRGFLHQGLVRKGILDAEAFDPKKYEVGQTIRMPIDMATTFFEKVSHLFTKSQIPYVHEYESKTGIDLSSVVRNFPDLPQQGEVVLRKNDAYTVVEKGFDPSYVAGNCINGAYIIRFRQSEDGNPR